MVLPRPPPQVENLFSEWEKELKGPINADAMNGIINFDIVTDGPSGLATSSSPSSAFDSSQSNSDHSFQGLNFVLPSEFSNPFLNTPVQEKRKGILPSHDDFRKVSPKTLLPPYPPNGINPSSSTTLVSGPNSLWSPPESWAVEKTNDDPYNPNGNPELSEAHDSGSDEHIDSISTPLVNSRRRTIGYDFDVPRSRKGKQPNAAEHRITFRVKEAPPNFSYKMKIYRQDNTYHVVAITLQSTVAELNARWARKLLSADDRVQHNLYLKERGQGMLFKLFLVLNVGKLIFICTERMLGQHEYPAAIMKLRMEQAGYDFEDGAHLLGIESLGILGKFLYKSQLLAGVCYLRS
jgi:adenylate cyclase